MIKSNYEMMNVFGEPRTHDIKVCWVQTTPGKGRHGRKDADNSAAVDSFGARSIRNEMRYHYDIVTIDEIGKYDYACISLTSVVEMENVLRDIEKLGIDKRGCKIVLGGMGALNIWPLHHVIDIAVFGRAEGQINDILEGGSAPNVWRKADDPMLEGSYQIRQVEYLLPGEVGVGCPEHCMYCQYSAVRRWLPTQDGGGYRAADGGHTNRRKEHDLTGFVPGLTPQETGGLGRHTLFEDDWNRLDFRTGRNQTAWDGWSEATRKRVRKRVSNEDIIRKLTELREQNNSAASNLKIYQIVGYPWETPESLRSDMTDASRILAEADGPTGSRIVIMFSINIFSPELFTALERQNVVFERWRDVINEWQSPTGRPRQVYSGKCIEAFILPQIDGPLTLQKRIAMNRSDERNADRVRKFVLDAGDALPTDAFYERLDANFRSQAGYLRRKPKTSDPEAIRLRDERGSK